VPALNGRPPSGVCLSILLPHDGVRNPALKSIASGRVSVRSDFRAKDPVVFLPTADSRPPLPPADRLQYERYVWYRNHSRGYTEADLSSKNTAPIIAL